MYRRCGSRYEKRLRAAGVARIAGVDELSRLLKHATAELRPYLTIGTVAGLRRAELQRLDWKEIDLDGGLIEIPANKAKSAQHCTFRGVAQRSTITRKINKRS